MSPRLRRLPLRGRDYELGVLSEQLATAHSGAGSVTVIEAGPGLGKTRLVEEGREGEHQGESRDAHPQLTFGSPSSRTAV